MLEAGISASEPLATALHDALGSTTAQGAVCAAFGKLRTISKDAAKRLGFNDAATHDADEATHCLFEEALSIGNPNQGVIGLAPAPSDTKQAYRAGVNRELVFMELTKLAQYLETKPQHPLNRQPLDASNIRNYAFRIE